MDVTVSGPQSGLVTAEPPSTLAPTSGSNYNFTFGIPGPLLHWPEVTRASSKVDAFDLDSPDTNLELSSLQSTPAAYHPPSNRTAEVHAGTTDVNSCSLTYSGEGTIRLQPHCGTATVTPNVGSSQQVTFNPGSSYTVPIGGATLDFGSIVLGGSGGSVLTSADDCFSFVPRGDEPGYMLSSGSVWVHIGAALCGPVCVGVDAVAGGQRQFGRRPAEHRVGRRAGCDVHADRRVPHRHILHVISGAVKLTSTYHGINVRPAARLR